LLFLVIEGHGIDYVWVSKKSVSCDVVLTFLVQSHVLILSMISWSSFRLLQDWSSNQ